MNWGVLWLLCWVRPSERQNNNLRARSTRTSVHQTGMSSARYLIFSRESFEVTVSGGSTFARVKLKEIDGMAPQDVERAV